MGLEARIQRKGKVSSIVVKRPKMRKKVEKMSRRI
jgi:hypothetical protein